MKCIPLIARCAPDWHSEHMSKSYVAWILIFGFTFPAVVIAVATIATCFNIQQVRKEIIDLIDGKIIIRTLSVSIITSYAILVTTFYFIK